MDKKSLILIMLLILPLVLAQESGGGAIRCVTTIDTVDDKHRPDPLEQCRHELDICENMLVKEFENGKNRTQTLIIIILVGFMFIYHYTKRKIRRPIEEELYDEIRPTYDDKSEINKLKKRIEDVEKKNKEQDEWIERR